MRAILARGSGAFRGGGHAYAESVSSPVPDPTAVASFWAVARAHVSRPTSESPPEAWAFGATPEHADGLLALVLEGTKTGTSSAMWDYEASGDPVPQPGQLDIVVDGAGRPRALLENVAHAIVPFHRVDAAHAHAEGEGDRTLEHWRAVHKDFFTRYAEHDRGFSPEMPILIERFRVVYSV